MTKMLERYILLTLFWIVLIFSVFAQVSDQLIMWLSPAAVSIGDERLLFTLIPVLFNYLLLLFLFKKITLNRLVYHFCFVINTLFFLYYFYCQYIWDVGEWKLF
jgi:hypothetical protein